MKAIKEGFAASGYVIIRNFFEKNKINEALNEYKNIAKSFQTPSLETHLFSSKDDWQDTDPYFFNSAFNISPFFNTTLHKEMLSLDLTHENNLFTWLKALNKIGHNLHGKNLFFHDLFFSDPRLTEIATMLGYDEPCTSVFQTTLISKSLAADSQYKPHQDGSYIGANGKVLAYWIPLTPSRKNNGCLWGIPGSHDLNITYWYRKETPNTCRCYYHGQQPQFDLAHKTWLEVDPGDLLIFSGNFIHGSSPALFPPRQIEDLRIALTYHLGPTTNWDACIWLGLNKENCLHIY